MPAVGIGDGVVHAEIDHYDGQRFVLRYLIEHPGGLYEAADVRSRVIGEADAEAADDDAMSALLRSLMGALLAYLGAEAEAYRRTMGAEPPADGWSFDVQVAEWAYLNIDDLAFMQGELEYDAE
jgi:hypothetical protein